MNRGIAISLAACSKLRGNGGGQSLGGFACEPVVLIHTQNFHFFESRKPTSAVEGDLWAQGCRIDVRC
jgi:hypothetical protein